MINELGPLLPSEPHAPAVEMCGIVKRFGRVVACDGVDYDVMHGEIHGLLGQNGAGKSTLMRILVGLVAPDAGTVALRGQSVVVEDPRMAASLGVAMMHQHFSLVGGLTVWQNVTLGERGRIDKKGSISNIEELSQCYGLNVNPFARVDDLSISERQRVEIIKCLRRNPDVIVLDEPTSVLTLNESADLFNALRRFVDDEGRAVVLISHKLDEILNATDRVTIMRAGRVVARMPTIGCNARQLAREMIGHDISLRSGAAAIGFMSTGATQESQPKLITRSETESLQAHHSRRDLALVIRDAHARSPDGRALLSGLHLEVRQGEILGLAGVEGNGQGAVVALMSSLLELDSGTVEVGGSRVVTGRPGAMARAGVGVIPEDRQEAGCILDMSVAENLCYMDLEDLSHRVFLRSREIQERARKLVAEFGIVTPSVDARMAALSGGNQQRVVLARELARTPVVLVAAQPTHGLDIGAIDYVTKRLLAAAADGLGILLISAELGEILAVADRVAVIHAGQIRGEMLSHEIDLERLGLLMGGHSS